MFDNQNSKKIGLGFRSKKKVLRFRALKIRFRV
jgi:hypothetical protein